MPGLKIQDRVDLEKMTLKFIYISGMMYTCHKYFTLN